MFRGDKERREISFSVKSRGEETPRTVSRITRVFEGGKSSPGERGRNLILGKSSCNLGMRDKARESSGWSALPKI